MYGHVHRPVHVYVHVHCPQNYGLALAQALFI